MGRAVPSSGCGEHLHLEADLCAEAGQYVDQRISTEQVDTPPKEIADARLSHAEDLGCRFLLETARCNELLHLNHEIRPDQEMLGLVVAKPEQAVEKIRQRRSRIAQRLNVRNEVRFASSLTAALLDGLFEQPARS